MNARIVIRSMALLASTFVFFSLGAPTSAAERLQSWSLRAGARELSLEDRIEAQRVIEQVEWAHRVWPEANPGPKPPLSEVLTEDALRAKVEESLQKSALLDSFWREPLRAAELQAEIDRLSQHTQSPEILREMFEALGNDPLLIAECLARPLVAERRVAALFVKDERIHGAQRAALAAEVAAAIDPARFARLGGSHEETTLVLDDGEPATIAPDGPDVRTLPLSRDEWRGEMREIASALGASPSPSVDSEDDLPASSLPVGRVSRLLDRGDRFVAVMVTARSERRVTIESVSWSKRSYEDWSRETTKSLTLDTQSVPSPEGGYSVTAPLLTGCTYDTWTPTSTVNAPVSRKDHTAVWTGTEMIVWGGHDGIGFVNTGGRYNPATDTWSATSTAAAPGVRDSHEAVWTGTVMIVWGGRVSGGGSYNTGGRYSPASNSWTATSMGANLPEARLGFAAVWTGTQMVVWGGFDAGLPHAYLNSGGRYAPGTDSWTPTSTGANVPTGRYALTGVWTGSEMIVWGGLNASGAFNTGGRYNPSSDTWLPTSTGTNVPSARYQHSAVWTGSEMIIFGGQSGNGSRYSPASDTWSANATGGPSSRVGQTAVWTGNDMIAWGGQSGFTLFNNGGRFVPATNTWVASSLTTGSGANVPSGRAAHTAVFTGFTDHRMIVWGGRVGPNDADVTQTGGLYCAGVCPHGSACNDNSLCTTSDTCTSGVCAGTPVVCQPIDVCHNAGSCIVATGQCSAGTAKPDGATCNDGNACTASCSTCSQDACFGGVCSCAPGPCDQTPSRTQTTIPSTDVPYEIIDYNESFIESGLTVSIPGNPVIAKVSVQTFLRHDFSSDIGMTIRSPQGTVVTLTTHNGANLHDVFNGTVWDDDANSGGQVPYSVNHGLATDHDYADHVVASPLAPEEPLGAFVGENPNGVWILSVNDDQLSDGGSLDDWSMTLTTVGVTPAASAFSTYDCLQVPQTIPATVSTITAPIVVSGAGASIQTIRLTTYITHTSCGDLDMTLTSPAGTVVTLTTDNGGTLDNVFNGTTWDDDANPAGQVPYFFNSGLASDHPYANNVVATALAPEEGLAAFRGENPNGTWILTISDDTAGNGGTLQGAALNVKTATCPGSCVRSCDDADACTTDSCDVSLGCQHACGQGGGCVPGPITNIHIIRDGPTLRWDHATPLATSVHDVARGLIDQLPAGSGAAEVCLASGISETEFMDQTVPPVGNAFWYDVRGRSACGVGSWNSDSDGTPHNITVCP